MIEPALKQRLQTLAGGKVFFGVAPLGTAAPFVVLTQISGRRDWTLAGPTDARSYQVQVSCWASTLLDALTLAEQAFALLAPFGDDFGCGPVNELPHAFDQPTGLHGAQTEYTLQT